MPEAVSKFIETESFVEVEKVHRSIIETYQDDFPKYATKSESVNLKQLLSSVVRHIGKKVKYSELLKDVKHPSIKKALLLLENAKIILRCSHTNASGLPLNAQLEEGVFKVYFLDIGLLNNILGLSAKDIIESESEHLVLTSGMMAEQFIAQHLKYKNQRSASESLFYWLKDLKKEGAEIDFLVQQSSEIIPIEVKSGKSGTLKSLIVFMHNKKLKKAIRFDLHQRSTDQSTEKIKTSFFDGVKKQSVQFQLVSYPLFLIDFMKF
jgi:predicted AAA+ superfamily ATPase